MIVLLCTETAVRVKGVLWLAYKRRISFAIHLPETHAVFVAETIAIVAVL